MQSRLLGAALGCAISLIPVAQAELIQKMDGQVVYDTERNITWLSNANLAATERFGIPLGEEPESWFDTSSFGTILPDGRMWWQTSLEWIKRMNAANYLGFSNWRLPANVRDDYNCSIQDQDLWFSYGFDCRFGEAPNLYNQITDNPADAAKFNNIETRIDDIMLWPGYWHDPNTALSGSTAFGPGPFSFRSGYLDNNKESLNFPMYAWAVRDGDVPQPSYDPGIYPESAGKWIDISGKVMEGDTPVCALGLANGQYMFTCDGTGSYALEIPLDNNGQFKLQVYAHGFLPNIQMFDEYKPMNDVQMTRTSCQ